MAEKYPFITVVMPIRNESDFIAQSLGTVLTQEYPHEKMEVLIADGMSDDDTRAVVAQTAAEHPTIPVRVLDNPGRIVPIGMNIVFKESKGEIIVRVDGHCEIAPDYVLRCVEHLQKGEVVGVGGPIETISQNETGSVIAAAMSSKFGVGGSAFRTEKNKAMFADTVAFPAYIREAMEKAGPYDEEMMRNQDDEYNYRLRSMGYKILLTPDVRSKYYSRGSLRKLWKQYYQYGIYKVRVLQKHPYQMKLRQFVPIVFVVGVLGGAIVAPFSPILAALWLLGVGLYIVLNLLASVMVARQTEMKYLKLLPIVYVILHFSYGLGFLRGLVKFWSRWGSSTEPNASVA
jgi:succinoglycan biosynthesis protein ExoA